VAQLLTVKILPMRAAFRLISIILQVNLQENVRKGSIPTGKSQITVVFHAKAPAMGPAAKLSRFCARSSFFAEIVPKKVVGRE
jgi:hypothetical protein